MINIKGKKKVSLIAKDKSGDIVHEELFNYAEQNNYDEFFRFIKRRLNYPFKGITTDLDPMLSKSIKTVIGEDIAHQLCLKHSLDNIYRLVKYQSLKVKLNKLEREAQTNKKEFPVAKQLELIKLKGEIEEIDELIKLIKKFLWQQNKSKSKRVFKDLTEKYSEKYPVVIEF